MIEQFSPLHYGSMINISSIRPQISKGQIKSALKKIGAFEKNISDENKIKVEIMPNNTAKVDGVSIHYRICTQRPHSRKPWYSISESKMKELNEQQHIKTIICIFFTEPEEGSSYKISYREWSIDKILNEWKKEENSELYRWNPTEDAMKQLGKGVSKGNIKSETK